MTVAARMRVVCSCAESATAEPKGCEKSAENNHKAHKALKGRPFFVIFVIFVSFVVLGRALNRMAHYNPQTRPMLNRLAALVFAAALFAVASDPPEIDWPFYGGDQGGTKYSPLTD